MTFLKKTAVFSALIWVVLASAGLGDSYEQTGDRRAACHVANRVSQQQTVRGTGTLVIYDLVLTAGHVFETRGKPTVTFGDQTIDAKIIAVDQQIDIAVLRIDPPSGIKPLPIAQKSPEIGRTVEIWGFGPRVFRQFDAVIVEPILSSGDVHLLGAVGTHSQVTVNGDSGGPVVLNGQMVGLHWGYRERGRAVIHAISCEAIRAWLGKAL